MKLGRNDLCWCGSGKKFKHCHLGREENPPKTTGDMIGVLRKEFGRKECLAPNGIASSCSPTIARAHTISKRNSLSLLATDGHVSCIDISIDGLMRNNGRLSVCKKGINRASTFTGFCTKHDNELFLPIDDRPFIHTEEQCALLAYRAICRELYGKKSALSANEQFKDHDQGKPLIDQIAHQALIGPAAEGNAMGLAGIESVKLAYDGAILSNDFSSVRYLAIELGGTPDIMTSGAVFPEHDFRGEPLQDLSNFSLVLKSISFHLFSSEGRGFLVFSWLDTENSISARFVDSLLGLESDDILNAAIQFIFEFGENTFWSSAWWESLNLSVQQALIERCEKSVNPLMARSPTVLIPDGRKYVDWNILNISSNY